MNEESAHPRGKRGRPDFVPISGWKRPGEASTTCKQEGKAHRSLVRHWEMWRFSLSVERLGGINRASGGFEYTIVLISCLVFLKDQVVSFPLYVEAIKFAFHDESMVRTAVRSLTLNVYHVGDEYVNKYVSSIPQSDYFSDLVKYFQKQCISLDDMVSKTNCLILIRANITHSYE
ncbi:hypothetical protein KSP40_PGU008338 [Platanthera guangdongensis]|uniref:FPL domain-containing protein n=1 Tax=Platanthera guangdongensis TaxID=2320717 RepID=A0ABR2MWD4_9ASPA